MDGIDMLASKMDLLMKKMDENPSHEAVHALDSRMTCEVCRNTGHSGNDCPETRQEDVNFVNNKNNGFRPQAGWNTRPNIPFNGQGNGLGQSQPFFKNNNNSFDQKAVNDSISKKFHATDKILENISGQMESFTSAMKNQLSFNKMLETQIAQLAAALPNPSAGKLPGQPEQHPKENVNVVMTRGGKST